ncbi:MAG: hypothetical protein J5601_03345 [Elusimicrobiaceae bacterium]|nr:hypothetical protein [Elusimicrobiaceae bacterium]
MKKIALLLTAVFAVCFAAPAFAQNYTGPGPMDPEQDKYAGEQLKKGLDKVAGKFENWYNKVKRAVMKTQVPNKDESKPKPKSQPKPPKNEGTTSQFDQDHFSQCNSLNITRELL